MASTTSTTKPNAPSLPCKKRKASNASSSMTSSNGVTGGTVVAAETASTSAVGDSGVVVGSSITSTRSTINESRLPSKKRKESHDERVRLGSYDLPFFGDDHAIRIRKGSLDGETVSSLVQLSVRKTSHDSSLPLDDLLSLSGGLLLEPLRDEAETSSVTGADRIHHEATTSALDHLDALHTNESIQKDDQLPAAAAAVTAAEVVSTTAKQTKEGGGGGDDSSHDETFASSGHRLLMEAIMMSNTSETKSGGSGGVAAVGQKLPALDLLPNPNPYRERLDSFTARDRLDSFITRDRVDSFLGRDRVDSFLGRDRVDSFAGISGRDRSDSLFGRRDRLESWGGMSDLSVPLGSSDSVMATAMAAASNLHHGYLMEDPDDPAVQQAAAVALGLQQHQQDADNDQKPSAIPSKISLQRDRLNSIASLGDISAANFPLIVDGIDVTGDIQAFVAAAMASVGDQLEELAGAMEDVVAGETEPFTFEDFKREMGLESDGGSSVASPLIGAVTDAATRRPRSWSTSSARISVDLNAVQAAVDAAEAASGTLGLSSMAPPRQKPAAGKSLSVTKSTGCRSRVARRHLPLKRGRAESNTTSSTTSDERVAWLSKSDCSGMNRIRERARVAAGYVPPKGSSSQLRKNQPPLKKRVKRTSPGTPATVASAAGMPTPKVSNRTLAPVLETPAPPHVVSSCEMQFSKHQSGQANQKWDGMYECLLEFAQERLLEETKNLSEEEKRVWIWDGNVPTNYKTKDGKALGRWVNNQRSAKSKGTLKEDREQRLIDAGLKWSVLALNSWNEMLEELSVYIQDQHRQGKVWDGNVPTNYQIKSRPNGGFNGEDKNLGRWVNRQRSQYQAGKLRKDRQLALEDVGLKWSMLATTSWDSMYDTLKEFVDDQKKSSAGLWDGNVPANYRTNDHPPRSLGRWINRQRSAFAKNKLKKEYVDKLNALGLKWSVHHRNGEQEDIDDGDYGEFMEDELPTDCKGGNSVGKEIAEKPIEVETEGLVQAV